MKTSIILESVISLFIIILVGVYGSKRKIITSEINKSLINILIQIALPFMIVSSFIFTYSDTIRDNVIKTFIYSLIAYAVMISLSYLFLIPIQGDKKTILHFSNVFVNTGYIGFPILNSIYGAEGVIYGSIFNLFFVVLVWTYGIMLFEGKGNRESLKKEIKKIAFNPSILAVLIGITIMVSNIQLPTAILSSVKSIGNITGPLSMIIIGVILHNSKIKDYLKDWTIYYGIIVKSIVIPVICYLISLLANEKSIALNAVIIMTAMPASAMTSIFAENFNKEKEYGAIVVSLTTLFSLVTLPLLLGMII